MTKPIGSGASRMIEDAYHGQALITFTYDDGRRNNYEVALPLHEDAQIPAVFSVIAERTRDRVYENKFMTPFEVSDAVRRGVEISSHSLTHRSRLTDLDDGLLHAELEQSKEVLASLLPRETGVESFCVPFSKVDNRVLEAAISAYNFVRIDGKKMNSISSRSRLLNSYPVRCDTNLDEITEWIDVAIQERRWLVLMFHGVVAEGGELSKYDISSETLSAVLHYVNSLSREKILPVNFADARRIRERFRKEEHEKLLANPRPSELVLDEAPGYKITYHRNSTPTDKLVISFGGLPSKKTQTGFGSKFILNQGWDHIFVAQEEMTQYQHLSIEQFRENVSSIAAAYDVFAYGSSLGAYAALYFGGSVNARIIAAAPKNSAHPLVLQKRFADLGFRHRELTEVPHSDYAPLILFDPHRRDETKFIRKLVLPAYPEANLVELPYAGHTVLETMKHMGLLKPFMTTYIEEHDVLQMEIVEDGLAVFPAERGREAYLAREYERALGLFQQSLDIGFNSEGGSGEIKALLKLGRAKEAKIAIAKYEEQNGSLRGIPAWVKQELL